MPHPEAHVESSLRELGAALRVGIAQPALVEFLRQSLQIRALDCAIGLPRRLSEPVARRWLGTPHVRFLLARGGGFDGTSCEVVLPPEQALNLVDRVLGGNGRAALPGRAGLPSAAECGVLAYLAARCVRASEADLRVQDVRCDPAAPTCDGTALLWPLRVTGEDDVKLDIALIFPERANCPQAPVSTRLILTDELAATDLNALEVGDLLVSDNWSLYATASGISGLLELSVAGSDERVLVSLEGDRLKLAPGAVPARQAQLTALILARLQLSVTELAQLMDGASLRCPALAGASLEARGRAVAHGRLVRFEGQVALEVEALGSARDYSTR